MFFLYSPVSTAVIDLVGFSYIAGKRCFTDCFSHRFFRNFGLLHTHLPLRDDESISVGR
jgi:hypothetical protein